MPNARQDLRVLVYDTYDESTRVLQADLSGSWTRLQFSSVLHGGFKDCSMTIPMRLDQLWTSLRSEERGWHFYHLEITEDHRTVWEGRIMQTALDIARGTVQLNLLALGYWSSLRDQYYTNASPTANWKASDVIKDMLTNKCPDINSDQGNIDANARDIQDGANDQIDLSETLYPQQFIVDKLGPIADSDGKEYFAAVWENRLFYWKPKALTQVDWHLDLGAIARGRLVQDGMHVRNTIIPVTDGTLGTEASDADSQSIYPDRDLKVTVPKGLVDAGGASDDMRDAILADRKTPKQSQGFTIDGPLYSSVAAPHLGASAGALVERPKWWMRAGEVVRIRDLVPASVASPAFDNLRTFWLREVLYNAINDAVTLQPDSPSRGLGGILPRLGNIERDR